MFPHPPGPRAPLAEQVEFEVGILVLAAVTAVVETARRIYDRPALAFTACASIGALAGLAWAERRPRPLRPCRGDSPRSIP